MLEYYKFKVINELFMKGQLEDARIQLRELQKRYVDLCEENSCLKSQLREYEDILFLSRNFIFDGTFYWLITGNIKQGPFCPYCYNRDGQIIRVADTQPKRCLNCNTSFGEHSRIYQPREAGNSMGQAEAVGELKSQYINMEQTVLDNISSLITDKNKKIKAKIIPFHR